MGQSVYFEHKVDEKWILGKIKNILGDYTYMLYNHRMILLIEEIVQILDQHK